MHHGSLLTRLYEAKNPHATGSEKYRFKKNELTNDIITILENLERVHHCWITDFLATETVDVNACLN